MNSEIQIITYNPAEIDAWMTEADMDYWWKWRGPEAKQRWLDMAHPKMKTQQGKEAALKALRKRRMANSKRVPINNSAQPAGSPMYFACISCGATIAVPETYMPPRPKLCEECQALKDLGWLKE